MSEPVPTYAQEAYAILRNKFGGEVFPSDYLAWYLSKDMVKKTLHTLEHAGWIKRIDRGKYSCNKGDDIFKSMVEYRVPELLSNSKMRFSFSEASAVEVWTDYSYIQRNWEHSPYYIRILSKDEETWIDYFAQHKVKSFVSEAEPAIGEFVTLKPQRELTRVVMHNGFPVDSLKVVVKYCEKYIDAFEYPLAYLKAKFDVATSAKIDDRVLNEAARVAT
jgi:hypothetical protein